MEQAAEENRRLRSVIADMRREMESLRVVTTSHAPDAMHHPPPPVQSSLLASPSYNKHLSADVLVDLPYEGEGLTAMRARREAGRASGGLRSSCGPPDETVAGLVKENKELRSENEKLLTNCVSTIVVSSVWKIYICFGSSLYPLYSSLTGEAYGD